MRSVANYSFMKFSVILGKVKTDYLCVDASLG